MNKLKTYKVGLIRVLTTEDEELLQLHGKLIESYFPMLQVVSRCMPDQPEGIHDDVTFTSGVPKVVKLAVELWQEGCQAIIVSCAGDPGVAEAKQAVPIPVIGGGASTAALSTFFGSYPAVLGITEDVPESYHRILGDRIVNNAKGDGVENILDLMTAKGYEATMEKAAAQKALGADVIALSCTGMSSIQIASSIEKAVGIPVLDPVMCEGLLTVFELLRKEI